MRYRFNRPFWGLLLVIPATIFGCRKAYNPPAIKQFSNILVVEGDIESGTDSTIIKISHTVKISSKTTLNPEKNAQVTVENDQNTSYQLTEIKPGTYATVGLNLDKTRQYRLNIYTAAGKHYVSDLVSVLDSPPIDSVTWDRNGSPIYGTGVNINVSTHDASNKVHYFRWDYAETWEFVSAFDSQYKSNGYTVLPRDVINDDIYHCWKSDSSSSTLIASDAKLTRSIIVDNPVTFVHATDEKLSTRYSILVKQHALNADAYNFYANLKKNTEQIGSIFDAQPSELQGNIHNADDPSEPVIGYISVGAVSTTRLFIGAYQLPEGELAWTPVTYYTTNAACTIGADPQDPKQPCCYFVYQDPEGNVINQVDKYINYLTNNNGIPLIPVDALTNKSGGIIGYTASISECVDCTLRGSNKKPAFW